ncbi:anthranilate synthase component I family protein [Patescibacteria group bacterium]|nr:anthranilate synthase component I family protein [Patescibacteria group bacterium]
MKELPKIKINGKPKYIKFAQDVDFFTYFKKIEQAFDTCFIFESLGEEGQPAGQAGRFSRYSIFGFDPEHIISAKGKTLVIDGEKYVVDNPYFALREIMPDRTFSKNYAGGLVGYLSYDAVNYFEPAVNVKAHKDFDQFLFGVYTDGLILDKLTNELFYFYFDRDRSEELRRLIFAATLLNGIRKRYGADCKSAPAENSGGIASSVASGDLLAMIKDFLRVTLCGDTLTKAEHKKIVERVRAQIIAGNIFQCEVGFKTNFRVEGDVLRIYEELRKVNPSPFMYYLKFGGKKIVGASPELAFSLRDGEMTVRPLAGTIRRGKDDAEDRQLARMLLHDKKEIAEHTMLVDLYRNDIGKVARFGTVRIRDLLSIEKFSHVQHISSEISGLTASGEDMFSTFAANFPAGTLTGAPKIEAMKIIDANEPEARGPYGGAVGHFGFNGDCTFAMAIRSFFVSGEKAYAQTSGGIVYDSVAEKEYDEIQGKLAAMKQVLEEFGNEK